MQIICEIFHALFAFSAWATFCFILAAIMNSFTYDFLSVLVFDVWLKIFGSYRLCSVIIGRMSKAWHPCKAFFFSTYILRTIFLWLFVNLSFTLIQMIVNYLFLILRQMPWIYHKRCIVLINDEIVIFLLIGKRFQIEM